MPFASSVPPEEWQRATCGKRKVGDHGDNTYQKVFFLCELMGDGRLFLFELKLSSRSSKIWFSNLMWICSDLLLTISAVSAGI